MTISPQEYDDSFGDDIRLKVGETDALRMGRSLWQWAIAWGSVDLTVAAMVEANDPRFAEQQSLGFVDGQLVCGQLAPEVISLVGNISEEIYALKGLDERSCKLLGYLGLYGLSEETSGEWRDYNRRLLAEYRQEKEIEADTTSIEMLGKLLNWYDILPLEAYTKSLIDTRVEEVQAWKAAGGRITDILAGQMGDDTHMDGGNAIMQVDGTGQTLTINTSSIHEVLASVAHLDIDSRAMVDSAIEAFVSGVPAPEEEAIRDVITRDSAAG